MPEKKYLIFTVIIAVVTIGIFLVGNNTKKTFYIKNDFLRPAKNVEFGNLQDTIIPSILKAPKNLTEDFAGFLARGIISKNSEFKAGDLLPGPGISAPNPSQIVKDYIANGLKTANENIKNVKPTNLNISNDNSKDAVINYLLETQVAVRDNLKVLMPILTELQKNNGEGKEKLVPIISDYEAAANRMEEKPMPSNLKNLISDEIRLLRVTANILKTFTNIEDDPLATLVAIDQFTITMTEWQNFQKEFTIFVVKLSKS